MRVVIEDSPNKFLKLMYPFKVLVSRVMSPRKEYGFKGFEILRLLELELEW